MTTIISMNGKLIADRRKVVNHLLTGMVGSEIGDKITTTEFCHYATTGFVPRATPKRHIEATLAAAFALLEVLNPTGAFSKTPLQDLFYDVPGLINKVEITINLLLDRLRLRINNSECSLLAINHRYTVVVKGADAFSDEDPDPKIIGGGALIASILLHHEEPLESVYQAIRGTTLPTGAVYDECLGSVFDNGKLPPILHPAFGARVLQELKIFSRNANPKDPKEDMDKLAHDVVSLIVTLRAVGTFNKDKNKLVFNKKLDAKLLTDAGNADNDDYKALMALYKEGSR